MSVGNRIHTDERVHTVDVVTGCVLRVLAGLFTSSLSVFPFRSSPDTRSHPCAHSGARMCVRLAACSAAYSVWSIA